jgi:phosphatidylglycerol:prolipoprotein diacylglycerol transferase
VCSSDLPVHPTPLYEFACSAVIAFFLWRRGAQQIQRGQGAGGVFALYLIWSGVARFFVEFIKINPPVLWGLSNAQCVALLSVVGGVVLTASLWWRRSSVLPVP